MTVAPNRLPAKCRQPSTGVCWLAQHGERRARKGEHVVQKRGVFTAPTKRGGFGYNKTTLSELQGHKGVVGALLVLIYPCMGFFT